jgi:hypothetical protein
MKPTLTWKDGYAQGLPDGLTAYIPPAVDLEGRPLLIQWHVSDITSFGAYGSHYASVEAAQRACEVALWRLGVLPLPGWDYIGDYGYGDCSIGSLHASVGPSVHVVNSWSVSIDSQPVAHGGDGTIDGARHAAEVVLRALIADAIEQGATDV